MQMDIKTLVEQLLICDGPGPAKPLVDQLVARLCQITELDLHPALFLDDAATITSRGKAVSSITAAQCAEDVERTRVFLQGVYQAVTDQQQLNPLQPVKILYAGTGPFGLLMVPLLPLFDPARVRVTLLDIHQESLHKLKKLINCLNLTDYVHALHCVDVCEWFTPERFDLIISETMRQGLIQEPQVSVFANLQQFLVEGGCLIPEQIRLDLLLCRANNRDDLPAVHLGEVFRLDQKTAAQLGRKDFSCLSGSLTVPEYAAALTDLQLTTFIQVYRQHQLTTNQSQLTLPIYEKNARPTPHSKLSFHYQIGSYPRCVLSYSSKPSLSELPLPDSLHASERGIYHLPRMWHKTQLQKEPGRAHGLEHIKPEEWLLDRRVLDTLGVGLEPALQQLFSARNYADFEAWLLISIGGEISAALLEKVNQLVLDFLHENLNTESLKAVLPPRQLGVLSSEQWSFWQEHGYLIIPDVLTSAECTAACAAIWQFLGASEQDCTSWYSTRIPMQKIMVQLFRDPALEVARNKDSIRQVFCDLWQRDNLTMSTDRVSFNPPETPTWKFPGPDLHWDVQLVAPVPFGTQGMIYLTDTAADQGAFSCAGFS